MTALRRGLALLGGGHAAKALAELRPLLGALDGEEQAELAGAVFLAAHAAHDDALERRAAAEVDSHAPGSDVAAMVAAIRAAAAGGATAEAAAARWLRLAPSSPSAGRAFLTAVAARKDPRPADASARELLARAARLLYGGFARSAAVAGVKEADAACWRAVIASEARDGAAFTGNCPRAVAKAVIDAQPGTTFMAQQRIFQASDGAGIVRAARETAALAEAVSEPPGMSMSWLWFVAGDHEKARAALKSDATAKEPNSVDDNEALRLLLGAKRNADPRWRRAQFRRFGRAVPLGRDDDDGGDDDLDATGRGRKANGARDRDVSAHLACLAAARGQRPQATLAACGEAWRLGRRTPATAAALGRALFDNIEDARKQGLEVKSFLDQANAALGGRLPGVLRAKQSAWLVSLGRFREATDAAEQAWTAGAGHVGEGLSDSEFATAAFHPMLARYRAAVGGSKAHNAIALAAAAISAADVEVAGGYVGQARTFFNKDVDSAQEQFLALLEELLPLIDADLRDRALDGPGITRLISRLFDPARKDPFRDIAKDYPRSALGGVLMLEEGGGGSNPASEVGHAKALLARFPRNALVAVDAAFVFRKAGLMKEATATWNSARAARPDSALLRAALVTETGGKAAAGSASLASAEAHAKVLAAPLDVPSDTAALQIVDSDEHGVRAILPSAFQASGATSAVSFTKDGANIGFMRVPRVTYCEGLACLDLLVPGLEGNGFKQRWRRSITTPIGPGAEAYLQSEIGALIAITIPFGGHIYMVMLGGPPDRIAAEIPALRMAYLSMRPDDLVLPQPLAGKLRAGWLDARTILRLRALQAKPAGTGGGCPIASLLDAKDVDAGQRRQILAEAFMTTPWAATRIGLLACEPVTAPGSAAVTLAALWDENSQIRRIGAARAAAHPAAVLTQAKPLMRGDAPIEPPAGSTGAARDHRWTSLLLALPAKERAELARVLLRQDQPHLRAVGLLAPRVGDVEVGPEHLRLLRAGSTADARIAAQALPDVLTPPMREAIRARLDHAKSPLGKAEADALFELAWQLTQQPERVDRPRLERLARLASAGPGRDRARAEALLKARPEVAPPLSGAPLPGLDRPLAQMLPGRRWAFVRIERPARLLSRLSRLGHRLKAPTNAQQQIAQVMISSIVSEIDSTNADAGAIDLGRPIECAALDGNIGRLLCTASTRADLPDDLVTASRSLSILERVAGGIFAIPIALPGLPFFVHQGVYAKVDATRDGQEAALLRERAERTVGPGEAPDSKVVWRVELDFAPDGSGTITDRIVLRHKDRLFFSNSAEIARRFLLTGTAGPPRPGAAASAPAPALDADPDFQAISARLVPDADMTAILMPDDREREDKNPIALELTVTAHGIATRLRLPYKQQPPDHQLGTLWRLLPKDPTLVFGAADFSPVAKAARPAPGGAPLTLSKAEGAGLEPPIWLTAATPAVLFGWYPREGGRLWDDWLAAVNWDDSVAAAWRRHGMPVPASGGASAVKDGYRFKLVGRVLVVSNAEVLVSEASHRGETEAAPAREEPVKAAFDGAHVAASLEERAGRAPNPQVAVALRTSAALSSVVKTATLGSVVSRDGREVVIESLVTPAIEGGSGVSLIEEWQRERRLKNALRLPKTLGAADAAKPIRFLLEVEQDQQVPRAFPVTTRQKLERIAPGRWRMNVTPGPSLAEPVPPAALSAADRHRYTDAAGVAPRIQSAANEIVADKTPPKEAARLILEWMKRNMTYELTPRELRDEAILERRRGDCSEYSKLTIALLRAKGIPARTRSGFLADGGEMVAHAWVEFFDGTGWREIDPTEGAPSVDARYLDASLVDVMSLLSLAQIKVAGIE